MVTNYTFNELLIVIAFITLILYSIAGPAVMKALSNWLWSVFDHIKDGFARFTKKLRRVSPRESIYSEEQLYWINTGAEKGLDVLAYSDPRFDPLQMEIICVGLMSDVDVSYYADPQFDFVQMYEIFCGLLSHQDVSVYAKKEYSSIQMQKIRTGQVIPEEQEHPTSGIVGLYM